MVTSNSWHRAPAEVASTHWVDRAPGNAVSELAAPFEKRLLDVAVSAVALTALAPLMAAIMIAVKADSRGPVLYSSRRLGRNGRVFECLKFRTMDQDGKVTRLGGWLWRYGLDELPQFVNVLRGEMSVVGPRPVLAGDGAPVNPARFRRLEMTPGMTGLWPVHQAVGPVFGSYVSPDETYRRNWSPWLDLRMMMCSVGAALSGRVK